MTIAKAWQGTITDRSLNAFEANCLREDDPDGNRATDRRLLTRTSKGRGSRVIVRFDLTGIPPNATLLSAISGIYEESIRNNDQVITLCRLRESWSELASSWNRRDGIHSWAIPGGTFDDEPLVSFYPISVGFRTFDVTSVVRDWLSGTCDNNGFIILAKVMEDKIAVEPRERTEVNFEAPYLDLTYAPEGIMPVPWPAPDGRPISSSCMEPTPDNGIHRPLNVLFRFLSRRITVRAQT